MDARFIAPLDTLLFEEVLLKNQYIITLEDGCKSGGFGEAILALNQNLQLKNKVEVLAFPNEIIGQGTREQLLAHYKLNVEAVVELVREHLKASSAQQ